MLEIFEQSLKNRYFELECAKAFKAGHIPGPIYLGVGQEHIAACLASQLKGWAVFPQHRCHSYGLSFGIPPEELCRELLGKGLNNGMGGSASFGDSKRKIFGHSGLLGDQIPISAGYSFGSRENTLVVMGDAAVEEDYALGTFGFAATHKLPMLFICEDNNLSILTEKSVRRSWKLNEVAQGFGLQSYDIQDTPTNIFSILSHALTRLPALINIQTERHLWHAGVGQDAAPKTDRIKEMGLYINGAAEIEAEIKLNMEQLWQSQIQFAN